uniref:SKP1-like protein n=1 Tax=Oryza meridionalis TaxID=40149 RepID=A0A0E0EL06_9ORYZ
MAVTADSVDNGEKMILLISSDGERFELSEAAASLSKTLSHMIEDDCTDSGVVEYFNKHAAVSPKASATDSSTATSAPKASKEEELNSFDAEFVINVDMTMLFELIMAANYLNAKDLLDLTCQHAADLIKGMTVEQVREVFHIAYDFTPEEEAEIRKENTWAFDD